MSKAYRADIDGLRSIAVGGVVLFHAFPQVLRGGFLGVDVFFVISGFLITGILLKEHAATGRINLALFYARRVRRLLPALLLVITATLALGLLLVPASGERQALAASALSALLFGSNFYFQRLAIGYFADAAESLPLLHTWTLAVEEQFYIVWPLLIPLAIWAGARIGLRREPALWLTFATVFIISFVLCLLLQQQRPSWVFFLTPFRAWEFSAGAMLALFLQHPTPIIRPAAGTRLSLAGLALVVCAIVFVSGTSDYRVIATTAPVLGTAALIAAGAIAPGNTVSRALATPVPVYIGKISYGWYLWHWPLLSLVHGAALGDPSPGAIIAAVILSFALSAASYHLVESPIRHQQWRPFRATRHSLLAGAAMIALGASLSFALLLHAKAELAASPRLLAVAEAIQPRAPIIFPRKCQSFQTYFSGLAPWRDCLVGDKEADRVVMLVGDSHAAHLMEMLDEWGKASRIAVLPRVRGGCRALDGQASLTGVYVTASLQRACAAFNAAVRKEIGRLAAEGRLVALVVAGRWLDDDAPETLGALKLALTAVQRPLQWRSFANGLVEMGQFARSNKVRLVFMADTPLMPHHVPQCLARRTDAKDCARDAATARRLTDDAMPLLRTVARHHRDTHIVEMRSALCDSLICMPIREGIVLFKDQDHLSAAGSRLLAKPMKPALDAAILGR